MTLSELRYAVAVAQEKHFRRAAEKSFVTQPALSLAIQKLEEELGVQLFERRTAEVALTPIGEAVIRQAQRVLEEAARIQEIAKQGQDPLVGVLRLGVIFTVGPYLLPWLIPSLRKLAPDMPLEIEENTTPHLDTLLHRGTLDAIIVALPYGNAAIATRPLYDEPFAVMIPKDHAWARRSAIRPRDLAKERVLRLNSGHCFSNHLVEACPELSRQGDAVQQGNSLETIRSMVASGLGITVLPVTACADRFRSPLLRVVPFAEPPPMRRIALAWRKGFARLDAIETLARAISSLRLAGVHMLPMTMEGRPSWGKSRRRRPARSG